MHSSRTVARARMEAITEEQPIRNVTNLIVDNNETHRREVCSVDPKIWSADALRRDVDTALGRLPADDGVLVNNSHQYGEWQAMQWAF